MRTKITKEEYFNLDNGIVQNITREFIHPHIFRNQSSLITHLQEQEVEGFYYDDIENLYLTDEKIIKYYLDDIELDDDSKEITSDMLDDFRYDNPQEIFEWYLVSDWFLDRLREINEPIIDNDYGEYWGRCCTGQSIYLDHNMQELAFEYANDEQLYKNEEVTQ
jgi:hypothetical protein|tara:strand:+ start:125 stop:616 length:492 start_codon:yes stop_codon:yes gene_type:complete